MSLLIGVDLGTSETKAGLFDLEGNLLRLARREYPILTGARPGHAEQDPQTWWKAVCETLQEIGRGVDAGDLAALCVQGQGPSLVMVDAQGRPLANTILWMDTRTTTEQDELSKRLGAPVSPFASLPQAMWLKRHRVETYRQTHWFLTSWDFVAYRLCGRAASSILASFHPFPPQELPMAELPASLFAPAVEAGQPIAGLTSQAARQTGLPEGLPVVAGTHDGMATFIGAGLVDVERAADVNGTSGGLALCWNSPIEEHGVFSTAWIHPEEIHRWWGDGGFGQGPELVSRSCHKPRDQPPRPHRRGGDHSSRGRWPHLSALFGRGACPSVGPSSPGSLFWPDVTTHAPSPGTGSFRVGRLCRQASGRAAVRGRRTDK